MKISQSTHKMYSNSIRNFQESTTILNTCTKKSVNLLNAPRIYIYIYIRVCVCVWERERESVKDIPEKWIFFLKGNWEFLSLIHHKRLKIDYLFSINFEPTENTGKNATNFKGFTKLGYWDNILMFIVPLLIGCLISQVIKWTLVIYLDRY